MKPTTAMLSPAVTIERTLRPLANTLMIGTRNMPRKTLAKPTPNKRPISPSLRLPKTEDEGERARRQDAADGEITEIAPEEAVAVLRFDA